MSQWDEARYGDEADEGRRFRFGARETLATVIIVVLLVGIAWPLTVDQRKKAVDARVKADLTVVESAITEWVKQHDDVPTMTIDGTAVSLDGVEVAQIHADTTLGDLEGLTATTWCVTATNPDGKHAADPGFRYMASKEKIDTGTC